MIRRTPEHRKASDRRQSTGTCYAGWILAVVGADRTPAFSSRGSTRSTNCTELREALLALFWSRYNSQRPRGPHCRWRSTRGKLRLPRASHGKPHRRQRCNRRRLAASLRRAFGEIGNLGAARLSAFKQGAHRVIRRRISVRCRHGMSHNTEIFWPGHTNTKFFCLGMASVTSVTCLRTITGLIRRQSPAAARTCLDQIMLLDRLCPDVRAGDLRRSLQAASTGVLLAPRTLQYERGFRYCDAGRQGSMSIVTVLPS
jgi:hypothetical protein